MISDKFASHEMDKDGVKLSVRFRAYATKLDAVMREASQCRELSIAAERLEECVMWFNKAVAINGIRQDDSTGESAIISNEEETV